MNSILNYINYKHSYKRDYTAFYKISHHRYHKKNKKTQYIPACAAPRFNQMKHYTGMFES